MARTRRKEGSRSRKTEEFERLRSAGKPPWLIEEELCSVRALDKNWRYFRKRAERRLREVKRERMRAVLKEEAP